MVRAFQAAECGVGEFIDGIDQLKAGKLRESAPEVTERGALRSDQS
jgi:hypothetical protein